MKHIAEQFELPLAETSGKPQGDDACDEVEYEELRKCPGSRYGGISPRDPAFNDEHNLDDQGKCRQCHQQILEQDYDGEKFYGSFQAG